MLRRVRHGPAHRFIRAVRGWPLWELRGWLLVFVLAVPAAEFAALAATAARLSVRRHDLLIFAILLACNATTVELTRRSGEPIGLARDVNGVWELPLALLLPPFYALFVPIPRLALAQWRTRRTLLHRRIFSASAIGLSYGAASLAFHLLAPGVDSFAPRSQPRLLVWTAAALVCALLKAIVNKLFVLTAVKATDPATSIRSSIFSRESLFGDSAELAVAVIVAHELMSSPFMALLALPFVPLLDRSLRHSQLVIASRIDGKTGLLNATAWQREARMELARATRTQTPAAVAIADIDHFKRVNDTYGHLIGDAVLATISSAFTALLRDYDVCGRFGGEDFAFMLPQTAAEDAFRITERLRQKVSRITVPVEGEADEGARIAVTVSIGVATLHTSRRDLDELLAAADLALYQAKDSGRNKVCMLTEGGSENAVYQGEPTLL
jgi:diguanylate cyclase (GGDEF)-like protein